MRWRRGTGHGDVEVRRRGAAFPVGVGGGGIGLIALVAYLLISLLGGGNGLAVHPDVGPFPSAPPPRDGGLAPEGTPERRLQEFVAFVAGNVQNSWEQLFEQAGRQYRRTRVVIFTGATTSGCGPASAATGPFYCPRDQLIYVDLGFFRELARRGAPGDFAQAYVIAHEFGHHVQNVLAIDDEVRLAQQEAADRDEAHDLSVRVELQADCFAGVWGHSAYRQRILEEGDLEEGINAAAAVGDDRIQQETQGRVTPETFTHGTSEQRVKWFLRGFRSGDPNDCDTFAGDI
jgi:predicted metalloprotease